MKKFLIIPFILLSISLQAQFFIESETQVTVKPIDGLYIDENFENKGTLTLEADGSTEVIFDGNYKNTDGIVAFNDNVFRIGSGNSDSNSIVTLDFNPLGETVGRMIVDKTGGSADGQSGTIDVTTSLTMEDIGALNAENQVILISNSSNTAVVEPSNPNAVAKVTVQRHFFPSSNNTPNPPIRAFRLVSPSVTSSGTIHRDWQEGATSWNDTAVDDGFGIHITGNNTSQTDNSLNNGLDWNPSGNPSMFEYDNINNNGWSAVTITDDNDPLTVTDHLEAQKPYLVMVRGARITGGIAFDITSSDTDATVTTLRAKGELQFGDNIAAPLNNGSEE